VRATACLHLWGSVGAPESSCFAERSALYTPYPHTRRAARAAARREQDALAARVTIIEARVRATEARLQAAAPSDAGPPAHRTPSPQPQLGTPRSSPGTCPMGFGAFGAGEAAAGSEYSVLWELPLSAGPEAAGTCWSPQGPSAAAASTGAFPAAPQPAQAGGLATCAGSYGGWRAVAAAAVAAAAQDHLATAPQAPFASRWADPWHEAAPPQQLPCSAGYNGGCSPVGSSGPRGTHGRAGGSGGGGGRPGGPKGRTADAGAPGAGAVGRLAEELAARHSDAVALLADLRARRVRALGGAPAAGGARA
jgi:hypothetical protein